MPFCLIPFLVVAFVVGSALLFAIQKALGKNDRDWL